LGNDFNLLKILEKIIILSAKYDESRNDKEKFNSNIEINVIITVQNTFLKKLNLKPKKVCKSAKNMKSKALAIGCKYKV
jgi:hypothetical protein